MNTNRQNIVDALEGRRPERIPYTLYGDFYVQDKATWDQLFEEGLGFLPRVSVVTETLAGDVEVSTHREDDGKRTLEVTTFKTPLGTVSKSRIVGGIHNNWPVDHVLETPDDFAAMTYILRNTRLELDNSAFMTMEERVGHRGMTLVRAERTPYQKVCVDYAGLYNFSLLFYEDGFPAFLESVTDFVVEYYRLAARCAARYIQIPENLSSMQSGPAKYREYHMPAYQTIVPMLHEAGKRAYVHYDGLIRVLADLISQTDLDGIESFTLPPEGDMSYREAREKFSDKTLWTGLSAHVYEKGQDDIPEIVCDYIDEASADGTKLLFEISEAKPYNYRETVHAAIRGINRYAGYDSGYV